jgi:colanic acid/amylovoran biosynthesis protein
MSDKQDITIGLLWHSTGAGNLGVGALTVGNLIAARKAAEALGLVPRFKILEFAGDFGGPYVRGDDIESFEINGKSLLRPSDYWAQLKGLDCILDIGAGDSFADIYGAKRFAFLMATKELAYLRGVPLLFSPQTIGPFTRQPYRSLAAHAMRRAVAVVARDPQSMAAIGEIAPKARAVQSIDVAFRLPFERPARKASKQVQVGVNVSGLLFSGGYSGANAFGLQVDYAELMRRFIGELSRRGDARVHLICHVNSDRIARDDDGAVADRLAAEFPGVIRAPNFASPSDAKSYISGLDFLTAGRMHACIAAFSAGVPVVPIAYSRKFSGLFEGVLGYPYQVPVMGMTTDQAFAYLLDCLERREALSSAIADGQKVVAAALDVYDAELRRLFERAASRKRG